MGENCWNLGRRVRLSRGAWVAQLAKRLTSAHIMISQLVSLSPAPGSVLTAQSLEPALDSVSPSFSVPPLLARTLSLSKINIKKNLKKEISLAWRFLLGGREAAALYQL